MKRTKFMDWAAEHSFAAMVVLIAFFAAVVAAGALLVSPELNKEQPSGIVFSSDKSFKASKACTVIAWEKCDTENVYVIYRDSSGKVSEVKVDNDHIQFFSIGSQFNLVAKDTNSELRATVGVVLLLITLIGAPLAISAVGDYLDYYRSCVELDRLEDRINKLEEEILEDSERDKRISEKVSQIIKEETGEDAKVYVNID